MALLRIGRYTIDFPDEIPVKDAGMGCAFVEGETYVVRVIDPDGIIVCSDAKYQDGCLYPGPVFVVGYDGDLLEGTNTTLH